MKLKLPLLGVLLPTVCFSLSSINVHAQLGLYADITWQIPLGGTLGDFGKTSKQLSDGGYIFIGTALSNDVDVTGNHGEMDCWVVRLDSSRNIIWQRSLGGSADDSGFEILPTDDGGFILLGNTNSHDGDVSENYGDEDLPIAELTGDIWVVKLSADGILEWEQNYGGVGEDHAESITESPDGGYVIATNSNSTDFDVTAPIGNYDFWVFKISAEGDLLWEHSFGGSEDEYAQNILTTSDGAYIVMGNTFSSDGDVTAHYDQSDAWVVKIDDAGALVWQTSFGGTNSESIHAMVENPDGTFAGVGKSTSFDFDIPENNGNQDYILFTMSADGALDWVQAYGGSGFDAANDLVYTGDGYIIAGISNSTDGDVIDAPLASGSSFWIIETNTLGETIWQHCYGGTISESAECITVLPDGGYLVSGWSSSVDGDVSGNNGSVDYWMIELNTACEHALYYADTDLDGYGDPEVEVYACDLGPGIVDNTDDCDDSSAFVYPLAEDVCNTIDDNCNGFVDEDAEFIVYYFDTDFDLYGDSESDTLLCMTMPGFTLDSTDCNDLNADINPSAEDICNGIDDNCNGTFEEDATYVTYYLDADDDDFGDVTVDSSSCSVLTGYVVNGLDCDDSNDEIYPGAEEVLNGKDDNCNGFIDEGLAIELMAADAVKVYPNPASDQLYISTAPSANKTLAVFDASGALLINMDMQVTNMQIDISALPAGLYALRISGADYTISREFIVIR